MACGAREGSTTFLTTSHMTSFAANRNPLSLLLFYITDTMVQLFSLTTSARTARLNRLLLTSSLPCKKMCFPQSFRSDVLASFSSSLFSVLAYLCFIPTNVLSFLQTNFNVFFLVLSLTSLIPLCFLASFLPYWCLI